MLGTWQGTVVDAAGDVRPDATVEIKLESNGAFATLWQDLAGTIPQTNPAPVDANGFLRVYLQGNTTYRIKAVDGAFELNWRDVLIPVAIDSETLEALLTTEIVAGALTADALGDILNPETGQETAASVSNINTLFASEYIRVKRYAPKGTAFTGLDADRVAHTAAARDALLVANEHGGAKVVWEHGGFVHNGPIVPDSNGLELICDGADILGGSDFPAGGALIHSLGGAGDATANQAILDAIYGASVVLVRTNRPTTLEDVRFQLRLKQGFASDISGSKITGFGRACCVEKSSALDFDEFGWLFNGSWSWTMSTVRARGNGSVGTGFAFGVTGHGTRSNAVACNAVEARGLHATSWATGCKSDFGVSQKISGTFEGNVNGFDSQSVKALELAGYFENNSNNCIVLGGTNGTDYVDDARLLNVYINILAGQDPTRRGIRLNAVKNSLLFPTNRYDEDNGGPGGTTYDAHTYFIPTDAGVRVYTNTIRVRAISTTYISGFSELDLNKNRMVAYDGDVPFDSLVGADFHGTFRHRGSLMGLYNAAAVAKQTVSGSRGGNAALADFLTESAEVGWITDSTSA
jgi:hypothetical protein